MAGFKGGRTVFRMERTGFGWFRVGRTGFGWFRLVSLFSNYLSIISSRTKACKGIQVAAVSFPLSSPAAMFLSSAILGGNSAKTRPSGLIH